MAAGELPKITQRIEIKSDLVVVKKFNREIDESAKALEGLDKAAGEADATIGRSTKTLDRGATSHRSYTRAVVDSEKETRTLGRTLSSTGDEAENLGGSLDRSVRGFTTIGGRMRSTRKESDSLNKGMKDLNKSMKTVGSVGQAAFALLALKLPIVVAGFRLALQAVGALGAGLIGLVQSFGPLLNLVGLLPAALAAAVGGFGALLIAVKPVAAAIGQALDPKTFAGNGETARQKARRLQDAIRDVGRAQRDLDHANREEERSRKDLNEAYVDATNNLRDLHEEQDRGTISVQRAQIALTRAQEQQNLVNADSASTATDRLSATLDVQEAELDLKDAQEQRVESARKLHEADKEGIEGSDRVRDAKEKEADATQAITDAQIALTRAIEDQKDPQIKATSAAQGYADALKALSPEARKFVKTIQGQKGVFKDFKNDVQDALFKPINEAFPKLLGNANPIKQFFVESAGAVGQLGKTVIGFFGSKGFGRDIQTLGKNNAEIIGALRDPLKDVLKIFTDLAVVGGPFIKQLIDLAGGALDRFASKISGLRSSGGLAKFFQDGIDRAKTFGRIFADLFGGIRNILHASTGLGNSLLASLEKSAEKFKTITGSQQGQNSLKAFFDSAKAPLHEFFLLLKDVSALFINIGKQNGLAKVLSEIRTRGVPILGKVLDSVGPDFVGRLLDLAAAFGELFATLGGTSGPFSAVINALIILFKTINGALTLIPGLKQLVFLLVSFGGAIKALSLVAKITSLGSITESFAKIASFSSVARSNVEKIGKTKFPSFAALQVPIVGPNTPLSGKPAAPGKFAGGLGAGIASLAADIGPQIAITAALTGATILVTKQFEKWAKRTAELKAISQDFTSALKDENGTIADAAKAATEPLLTSRNQIDDLNDFGISVDSLSKALVGGNQGLANFRENLLDTGALHLQLSGTQAVTQSMDDARDAFIKTGNVLPGFTTDNNGLTQSLKDLYKQTNLVAGATLSAEKANGQLSQAAEDNARAQAELAGGLTTILNPALVDNITVLDNVRKAQQKANEERQRSIDQADAIKNAALEGIGSELGLNRAKDKAVKSGKALQVAEVKLAKVQFDKHATDEERQTALDEYNDALAQSQDDTLGVTDAAKAYSQSQIDLGKITDDGTTKFKAQQAALEDVFTQLGANSGGASEFIKNTQNALDQANFSAEIALKPSGPIADPFAGINDPEGQARKLADTIEQNPAIKLIKALTSANTKDKAIQTQQLLVEANQVLIQQGKGTASPISLPSTKPGQKPSGKAAMGAVIMPDRILKALAKGGTVGGGFKTRGPEVIVGEGRKAFPEFVIPTDPAHRKNALTLIAELLKRVGVGASTLSERRKKARKDIRNDASLGGIRFSQSFVDDEVKRRVPLFAGGGILDSEGILRAVLSSNAQALAQHESELATKVFLERKQNARSSPQAMAAAALAANNAAAALRRTGLFVNSDNTPFGGTTIGHQVGVQQNFAGAIFQVKDFDDFREQMENERRKANLAAVSSGRSPRR